MASLFSKIRLITLGNLHELVDGLIDESSIPALKQSLRDLETGKAQILKQTAAASGQVSLAQSRVAQVQLQIDTHTKHAEIILNDDDASNDPVGMQLLEKVAELEPELEQAQSDLKEAQQNFQALQNASNKIIAKHAERLKQLRSLENLERTTTAKEQTSAALQQAGAIGSSVDSVSVDNIEQRLRARAATANAEFDQAMDGLNSLDDTVATTLRTSRAQELAAKLRKNSGTTSPS